MKRGLIIAVLGPMGSGKTTIGFHIAYVLKKLGYRSLFTYLRTYHGVVFIMWRFVAFLILRDCRVKGASWLSPWSILEKYNIALTNKLIRIFSYIDVFFTIPLLLLFRFIFPKLLGTAVVSEEYLHSSISDYVSIYYNRLSGRVNNLVIRVLLSFLIRYAPDIVVFLDADSRILITRTIHRGRDFTNLKYIQFQRSLLLPLISLHDGTKIMINTTNTSIFKTLAIIFKHLHKMGLAITSNNVKA